MEKARLVSCSVNRLPRLVYTLYLIFHVVPLCTTRPIVTSVQQGVCRAALYWLQEFHYYNGRIEPDITEEEARELVREPLREMRQFYNLPGSDDVDSNVIDIMQKPRCQDEDAGSPGTTRRHRRYTYLANGTWTWKDPRTPYPIEIGFRNYLNGSLTVQQQEDSLQKCADLWASVGDLEFLLVSPGRNPNIEVTFLPMDGPLKTYGEGLSPTPFRVPPTSYIHLDSAENWVLQIMHPRRGLNLVAALCHEMGHALSLGHSLEPLAVMHRTLSTRNMAGRLHLDDVRGIISLYNESKSLSDEWKTLLNPESSTGWRSTTPSTTTAPTTQHLSSSQSILNDNERHHISNVFHRLARYNAMSEPHHNSRRRAQP